MMTVLLTHVVSVDNVTYQLLSSILFHQYSWIGILEPS